MRKRITRMLFAATAAGVAVSTLGFTAAGAAGAAATGRMVLAVTGGTPIPTNANCTHTGAGSPAVANPADNCARAGYQASGRNFRYAQALITVPDHVGVLASDPMLYVALDDTSAAAYDYARVGVEPVCTTVVSLACTVPTLHPSGWVAFAQIREPNGVPLNVTVPLALSVMGDGVLVSVYFDQVGNSIHVVVTPPGGVAINQTQAVTGPLYTKAQALADWSAAAPEAPVPANPKFRDTQFLQGRFTTNSGAKGTFNGPWTLNAVEATTNGSLPPAGTLVAQPSYLWSDTSGISADAFGVWRFPF
jgi:hypothetical protein